MRPDLKRHAIGGLIVALVALGAGLAALYLAINPLTAVVAVASCVGASVIEGAQWIENRGGVLPTREVSFLDWIWTAAPGLVLAAIIEWSAK
ncbi:hypothetical protein [Roseateles sp.]|uniref:hypothetical protein n=1 Tax=Roseateles sp. TaxID=1971397 RepID=UPI003BA5D10B